MGRAGEEVLAFVLRSKGWPWQCPSNPPPWFPATWLCVVPAPANHSRAWFWLLTHQKLLNLLSGCLFCRCFPRRFHSSLLIRFVGIGPSRDMSKRVEHMHTGVRLKPGSPGTRCLAPPRRVVEKEGARWGESQEHGGTRLR